MNTYAYLIKAKAKAEAKSLFCWLSAKSDSRAEREILNILEDNGIDVGRGADYNLPVRTNWHVVDDLPAEGVLDQTWCDRYQLAEDGVTWQAIPAATPAPTPAEVPEPVLTTESTESTLSAPLDDGLEHPVAQMPFRKIILSQFISNDIAHHVTQAQRIQIAEMELDQDNYYVQNLLLATENTPDVKSFSTSNIWKLTAAVKQVFPVDSRPELGVLIQFIKAWVQTPHIDRGLLVKEWVAGNRISSVTPLMKAEPPLSVVDAVRQKSCNEKLKTDTGTNAGGEVITDRQNITSHTLDVLDIEIAAALLPMDFNIYEFPGGVLRRAKEVIREKEEPWKSWSSVLRKTAGVLDFSRAAIFVLIRNAPEDIHEEIPELIGYVSRNLVEVAFVPDTGIDDSETRWNALQKLFIRSDTGEASPETPAEPAAEGELVKVAAGVFDASSLFTAATKTDTADAGQPAETAENVQMEENHGDETEADIEVQMGETADVPAECGADVNHPSEALNNDSGHQITRDESSRLFTHLMIDIDTMGKKPGAPVVSIGAVFFAPDTGETGAEFYQVISLESCMSFGAVPDASTILWWLKQSAEARSEILVDDAVGLVEALEMFDNFIADNAANGSRKVQLWGNGSSFDCSLIETAFELADIPFPIEHWNYRDVRTIVELGKAVGINPRYEIPFEGELHNALDDARHQVKYVSEIWQVLTQI